MTFFSQSRPNIILTGFMGTGKTTVGKLLAEQIGYEFVDTDELIEYRSGMKIHDIFIHKGEEAFRQMEADLVQELSETEGHVVSTGGRLMLDPENAAALSKKGRVFCLVATPEEILKRIHEDAKTVRPLLQAPNPKERIIELMQQREKDYGQFLQLITSEKSPNEVADNLLHSLHSNLDLRFPIHAPDDALYEFLVGGGLLPFVKQLAKIDGRVVVITDSHVGPLYAKSLMHTDLVITIPPGQQSKTLSTVQSICEQLVENDFDRESTLIGLGGSVICGLAGFVAATYMRGIDCVHCPTSLASMADTSIGGKSGVNLPQGINLIGVFKQPKAVIADVATLQSLSPQEFACGMAEIIKHSIIADPELLRNIRNGNWKHDSETLQLMLPALQTLVAQAIQVKINIIQQDPFEQDYRAVLNLGHTFAYAIEYVSDHRIRHGEAVGMGLVAAANLSARMGYCSQRVQEHIESALQCSGLSTRVPGDLPINQLLQAMKTDKKKRAGRSRFVLIKDIGETFIADDVPQKAVYETLEEISDS